MAQADSLKTSWDLILTSYYIFRPVPALYFIWRFSRHFGERKPSSEVLLAQIFNIHFSVSKRFS